MKSSLHRAITLALLAAPAAASSSCESSALPSGLSYGSYSGNPQCVSGGSDAPFGFEYGWKMNGCQSGTFTLDTNKGEIKGSCPVAGSISVSVTCNDDKSVDLSWSGGGDSKVVVKVKGGDGGTLYDTVGGTNSGNFIAGTNNGGQTADISHIELCVQCTAEDCSDGGSMTGDPHIKTWKGDDFDFHGECDLNLVHAPKFDGELDMDIHARTKIAFDLYSFIETAAIRIGDDVLEVAGHGEYAVNGVDDYLPPSLPQGPRLSETVLLAHLGGSYPVYHRRRTLKLDTFDVVLGPDENVTLTAMKQWVGVKFHHARAQHFRDSVGLVGSWRGEKLARDGVTDLSGDLNALGQEWQVRDDEPKLFMADREPRFPHKCWLPRQTSMEERRLLREGGVSEEAARTACGHLKGSTVRGGSSKDFAACVYDVTASNDLDAAENYF